MFSFNGTYELPIGPGKAFGAGLTGVADKILSGWQVGGILSLRSGLPGTAEIDSRLTAIGVRQELPDLAPGASNNPTRAGNSDQYFDTSVFLFPAGDGRRSDTTLGNTGRNTMILPGLATVDFSMTKNTRITERANLQFRFEAFNFFNRVNFGFPALSLFHNRGNRLPTAGRIDSTSTTARQIQFGLKLIF